MVNRPASRWRVSPRSTREPWRAVAIRNHRRTTAGWRREQSPVERALQRVDQILDLVITEAGRQTQEPGMNHERLGRRFSGRHQSQTKKMVYARLQRSAGTPQLPAQELRDIVVERERGAHIMMLANKAS